MSVSEYVHTCIDNILFDMHFLWIVLFFRYNFLNIITFEFPVSVPVSHTYEKARTRCVIYQNTFKWLRIPEGLDARTLNPKNQTNGRPWCSYVKPQQTNKRKALMLGRLYVYISDKFFYFLFVFVSSIDFIPVDNLPNSNILSLSWQRLHQQKQLHVIHISDKS